MAEHQVNESDKARLARIIGLVKERISFVKDLWEQISYFYIAPETYDPKAIKKRWKPDTPVIMQQLIELLSGIEDFGSAATEAVVIPWIEAKRLPHGKCDERFPSGRCRKNVAARTCSTSPKLSGKDETIRRLRVAIEKIIPAND